MLSSSDDMTIKPFMAFFNDERDAASTFSKLLNLCISCDNTVASESITSRSSSLRMVKVVGPASSKFNRSGRFVYTTLEDRIDFIFKIVPQSKMPRLRRFGHCFFHRQ